MFLTLWLELSEIQIQEKKRKRKDKVLYLIASINIFNLMFNVCKSLFLLFHLKEYAINLMSKGLIT
jgi:hypothetical protein